MADDRRTLLMRTKALTAPTDGSAGVIPALWKIRDGMLAAAAIGSTKKHLKAACPCR